MSKFTTRGHIPKGLLDECERHADKVLEVGNEKSSGDGYWVILKSGWRTCDDVVHAVHEDTAMGAARMLRAVVRCECRDCKLSRIFCL
ncbi:MAG TPA: hypothetical protein VEH04_16980 [Verrucomicrobiae bacterium]|nr:hypothetical protein [Verrucomicrobiae bacterium]